ncbi:lipid-A-disaccharide synthase N-terminal domain-containing protein [Tundrisphaera sp. TA3]|uniref:lipid-A-disaccharide synthase N-terminal domain-containing protein n=1 Tax=Tundrisphaera sp. TA3 TaxID=3435775 RepID=UPI003EB71531
MTTASYWLVIGVVGQGIFALRFLIQWIASEKKRDSVVPIAFWWLSLLGGIDLLAYAIYRREPVIIMGQVMGIPVYARNLFLIVRARRAAQAADPTPMVEPRAARAHKPRTRRASKQAREKVAG